MNKFSLNLIGKNSCRIFEEKFALLFQKSVLPFASQWFSLRSSQFHIILRSSSSVQFRWLSRWQKRHFLRRYYSVKFFAFLAFASNEIISLFRIFSVVMFGSISVSQSFAMVRMAMCGDRRTILFRHRIMRKLDRLRRNYFDYLIWNEKNRRSMNMQNKRRILQDWNLIMLFLPMKIDRRK